MTCRKQEIDTGSNTQLALNNYVTADPPHKRMDLRYPQTSAVFALGRKKWVKNLLYHFRRHPLTAILDADTHIPPRAGELRAPNFHRRSFGADLDIATAWHRITRV